MTRTFNSYQLNGNTLSGRVTQSGVQDNFMMLVPIYLDFGKGKRAAICVMNDVLALSIQNSGK